jgi:hypothetical protein
MSAKLDDCFSLGSKVFLNVEIVVQRFVEAPSWI